MGTLENGLLERLNKLNLSVYLVCDELLLTAHVSYSSRMSLNTLTVEWQLINSDVT